MDKQDLIYKLHALDVNTKLNKKFEIVQSLNKYVRHNFLQTSSLKDIFTKAVCIKLVKHCYHLFSLWFFPQLLRWETISPAFAYYISYYPDFKQVFFPTYYVFRRQTIQTLIGSRLKDFNIWGQYIKLSSLERKVPKRVYNALLKKNLDFSQFYTIYNSYGNMGPKYVKFIELYLDKDFSEYYQMLEVSKLI